MWRAEYNQEHSHSGWGCLTPAEFARLALASPGFAPPPRRPKIALRGISTSYYQLCGGRMAGQPVPG
jgi:hypothetical protein